MRKRKLVSLTLALMLLLSSVVPAMAKELGYSDTEGHWAEEQILKWSKEGLLQGSKGQFRPGDNITRAEMAVIVDRLMDYQIAAENGFLDLHNTWYTEAILKNSLAGVIKGADGAVRPEDKITRQEAVVMLSRALGIEAVDGSTTFTDDSQIGDWAKGYIKVCSDLGYIKGMPDGSFAPQNFITRASVVKIVDNAIAKWITEAGTVTETVEGTVVINTPDVTLKDTKIAGDLIIAAGVGEGEITIDNTRIDGQLIVYGGGENSIEIKGTTSFKGIVVKKEGKAVRVIAEAGIVVPEVTVTGETKAIIEGKADFKKIKVLGAETVEIREGTQVSNLEVEAEAVAIENDGTVNKITVGEKGTGTVITGIGTVEEVVIGADNISIDTEGTKVVVEEGVEGTTVNGKETAGGTTTTIPSKEANNDGSSANESSTPHIPYTPYIPDTTAPVITVDTQKAVIGYIGVDAEPDWTTFFSVSDNRDGNIAVTGEMITENVDMTVAGTYTVTVDVADRSGNQETKSISYTVANDEDAPVITVVDNKLMSGTVNVIAVEPDWTTYFTVTDNAHGNIPVTMDMIVEDVDISITGLFVVTLTVSDTTGNTATETIFFKMGTTYMAGDGTSEASAFQVESIEDLSLIGKGEAAGDGNNYTLDSYYVLVRDLDFTSDDSYENPGILDLFDRDMDGDTSEILKDALSSSSAGYGFTPIAKGNGPNITFPFTGSIDGKSHKISNMYINTPMNDSVGFIGLGEGCTIKNIGFTNASVTGQNAVGIVAGELMDSTISNSYADGKVEVKARMAGGLVGYSELSTVENSNTSGVITGIGVEFSNEFFGGLIGEASNGEIVNSSSIMNVTGKDDIGGLVGRAKDQMIQGSSAKGNVSGNDRVGGLIGSASSAIVENSHAVSSVSGDSDVGGLIGQLSGGLTRYSYATGNVEGNSAVGGLVGDIQNNTSGAIMNSYATGNVSGQSKLGGLIGHWYNPPMNELTIGYSYASGSVLGDTNYPQNDDVGGIVGHASGGKLSNTIAFNDILVGNGTANKRVIGNEPTYGTFETNYAKADMRINSVQGTSGALDDMNGADISAAQFAMESFFTTAENWTAQAWDFTHVWELKEGAVRPTLREGAGSTIPTIPVVDTIAPVVNFTGKPVLFHLGVDTVEPDWTEYFTVVDNIDGNITVTQGMITENVDLTQAGNYTVTVSVTDSAGNNTTSDLRINVVDLVSPVITIDNTKMTSTTIGLLLEEPDWKTYFTVTDNVDGTIPVTVDMITENVDITVVDTYTVSIAVTDSSGNAASASFNYVVFPDIAPTISIDTSKSTSSIQGVLSQEPDWTSYFSITDDVDGNIPVTSDMITENVDLTATGVYTVTLSLTDSGGNSISKDLTYQVLMDEPPNITVDNTKITSGVVGVLTEKPDWTTYYTVTDDVDGAITVTSDMITDDVDLNQVGTYEVLLTVTDSGGNTESEAIVFTMTN